MQRADFAVIGRGLMGTACALYLARAGCDVALIGPDEPQDRSLHNGPFGSFHDAGRITRAIADDPVWARFAQRSIARYDALQQQSGIGFFDPCGAMVAGPSAGHMAQLAQDFLKCAAELQLAHQPMDDAAFAAHHPYFRLSNGSVGAFDPTGGVIDPRAMRQAHETLAIAAGADVNRASVVARHGGRLDLSDGTALQAGHVVLAMGGWSAMPSLGHAELAMRVYQRTVLLVGVDDRQADLLAGMPSLIFVPDDRHTDLYVLPPIRYPDGHRYIKIGGEAASPIATDAATLNAWFKTEGSQAAATRLCAHLHALMPELTITRTISAPCAVSFTATGHPYIGQLDDATTVLTGGNGAAAKCADELGRLGAMTALGGDIATEGLGADLAPVFM
ncbi:NAD(P)/FAD-dependent oxidoreductase [Roseicyclus sp.]|uniref:NAD(P)/FAD-dependent oxidoreductase n=1 Tax=Roseicyclus sp. TaxID=1914329 RepID=UPI003F6AE0D7